MTKDGIARGLTGKLTGSGVAGTIGSTYLQSQGIDPAVLSDPSPQNIAKTALTAYLVSMGVPPMFAGPIAGKVVDTVASGDLSQLNPMDLISSDAIKQQAMDALKGFLGENGLDADAAANAAKNLLNDIANLGKTVDDLKNGIKDGVKNGLSKLKDGIDKALGKDGDKDPAQPFKVEEVEVIKTDVSADSPEGPAEGASLTNVQESRAFDQQANEAVEIDRQLKDVVKGFLPPMNWWDKLPDWPAISYTAIIMDQTRAAKKYILDGQPGGGKALPSPDEIEAEIESHKFPYKDQATATLKKGMVEADTRDIVVGHELIQKADDKDTVKDTKAVDATIPMALVNQTTQTNTKYFPKEPVVPFPLVYRDDLTDQKNPALDLVDMQKLVDEFLAIGQRIYDQQTENPTIFGFDQINSRYEKDKNIVLANYKQYKANIRRMEHINNIVESQSNNYLIQNITYRQDIPMCSTAEEWATRYLREKLLAWYNETADPQTKIWKEAHWLPGEPGQIEELLTVGNYEWYNNLIAGLEDSVARLEDLESTLDLLSSLANVAGTIEKYKTAIEIREQLHEIIEPKAAAGSAPEDKVMSELLGTVAFTPEIIDDTMLEELLNVSEVFGSLGGEITAIRSDLEGLRWANQSLLGEIRMMDPTFLAYPTIWTKLEELCLQVNADIFGPLNILILNLRADQETAGWHSSPSHLLLDIAAQLQLICTTVMADVQNIIDQQAALPTEGWNRLDSMLNKINEIRILGPLCSIPWHYWMSIDNVNAAERLYNDIWSDVFDCWEREYITRVWRIVTEHHEGGVLPPVLYGKPLFSAECPHHLPLLLAPVPVDYRDIDINYLSANCRKHFNFLTSWLTSTLYAIGIKRVALGAVITDTSLNGDDANMEWLGELNDLETKNVKIKDEMDHVISRYNGTEPLVPKADLDEIIAAKELSPTHYSNQVLLNMSSELHLANVYPVTVLDQATNENRTGTDLIESEPLEWQKIIIPADISEEKAKELKTAMENAEKADKLRDAAKKKVEDHQKIVDQKKKDGSYTIADGLTQKAYEVAEKAANKISESMTKAKNEALAPYTVTATIKVNTKPTTGGSGEQVEVDLGDLKADDGADSEGSYAGDVKEFEPWHYMEPKWDTQGVVVDPPIVTPPEPAPVIPDPPEKEMPEEVPNPEKPVEDIKVESEVIKTTENPLEPSDGEGEGGSGGGSSDPTSGEFDPEKAAADYLDKLGIDVSNPLLKTVAKQALSAYLQAQGVPAILADPIADRVVEEAASRLSKKEVDGRIMEGEDPMVRAKTKMVDDLMKTVATAIDKDIFDQQKNEHEQD